MKYEFPEDWPQQMTVTKILRYDLVIAYEFLCADREGEKQKIDVTFEDVVERIYELAKDDFSCGWGHEANIRELIFEDENGEEY